METVSGTRLRKAGTRPGEYTKLPRSNGNMSKAPHDRDSETDERIRAGREEIVARVCLSTTH